MKLSTEIQKSAESNGLDTSIAKDVTNEINKVKEEIDEATGPIKRQF